MKNEKIMETLMVQANSGMYRVHDTYFEECKQKLERQDSKVSSEWDSFDMALCQKLSQDGDVMAPPTGSAGNLHPGSAGLIDPGTQAPIVGHDIFVEETASIASKHIDEESEWSIDIPNTPN